MRLSGILALSDFSKRLRQRQHDADGYGNRTRHIHSEHERESQVVPVFTDRSPHRGLAEKINIPESAAGDLLTLGVAARGPADSGKFVDLAPKLGFHVLATDRQLKHLRPDRGPLRWLRL